jgi:NAD(P)-dependent dehydrogenase (short-subunit alcohol dehydrogenase family)
LTAAERTVQTAVITGANSGLGFSAASHLARAGARVVMACRNLEKGRRAQADLLAELPGAETLLLPLDVSEPASICEFGRQFGDRVGRLDLLINNAGMIATPLARNSVGHEIQLATNYLGAFGLTGMLLPYFPSDAPARIVNVGSLAHRVARLDLDDLNWEHTAYREWAGYARSKLALLTFTMELNRRLHERRSPVIAVAAHPGFAATEIGTGHPALEPKNPLTRWLRAVVEPRVPTPAEAARPILHAACAEGVRGADYYGPGGFLEIAGEPGRARVNPVARDVAVGRRLWSASESMTGIRYLSNRESLEVEQGIRENGEVGAQNAGARTLPGNFSESPSKQQRPV